MHMDMSQEPFCIEIYRDLAEQGWYHLDWTPGLNCYRKNPSVWPHCLGNIKLLVYTIPMFDEIPILHHIFMGGLSKFGTIFQLITPMVFPPFPPFLHQSRSILDGHFNPLVFWHQWDHLLTSSDFFPACTLWWTNILLWKITIFNGKIHYFYGHFQ